MTRDPSGDSQTTVYVRDSAGFGTVESIVESAHNAGSRTTSITYDSEHLFPTSVTNTLGQTTQVSVHPAWGEVETVVDANGVPAQQGFDGFGRVTETVGPDGTTTRDFSALPVQASNTLVGTTYPRVQVKTETYGAGIQSGSFGGLPSTNSTTTVASCAAPALGFTRR